MKRIILLFLSGLLFISLAACDQSKDEQQPKPQAAPEAPGLVQGTVAETMDSGGYTYFLLKTAEKEVWVAVRQTEVAVGEQIAVVPEMTMQNFESPTLKRTFPEILFAGPPIRAASAPPRPATPAGGGMSGMPHPSPHGDASAPGPEGSAAHGGKPVLPKEDITVSKAEAPNAYTVGELYEDRIALDQQEVVVRGKVVKVLSGIMGHNWLHLQDGTGDSEQGSHDLVVTTNDLPSVGDIVVARGRLAQDKDFGFGYKYDVIVEEATVTE
jgi:hypothetical protein